MKNNNKIIAANWKMNGSQELMKEFSQLTCGKHNDIIICPPFTLLDSAKTILPNFIKIGAQNCSEEEQGAFTGEISASMLQERGVSYVLLGHSERRTLFKETDAVIFKKALSAIKNKLIPVFTDIEPNTYCIDTTQIEELITPKTVAIVAPNAG